MNDLTRQHAMITAFGQQYDYDTAYMTELLDASPAAYAAFAAALPLSSHRQALPLAAHFVARITTLQAEDCGACTQLNLRMAVEAGVDRAVLATLLARPDTLPAELADIRAHVLDVVGGSLPDPERAARIRARHGDAGFAELATAIAGSRLFPTIKRALMHASACQKPTLDF